MYTLYIYSYTKDLSGSHVLRRIYIYIHPHYIYTCEDVNIAKQRQCSTCYLGWGPAVTLAKLTKLFSIITKWLEVTLTLIT